jgi:hypothetical protein
MNETDVNDWYIELHEDCSCERRELLSQREGQVIREIGTLNTRIGGRTKHEYREENKDKDKEYREENEEFIKEYNKEHNKDNKEQLSKNKKEYYLKNKEKIQKYACEIVFCECGCIVRKSDIAKHKRTNKHLDIMKKAAKTQEQT